MTCVTCGVELPEGAARSAMSGQWLCAEHKVLAAEKSWVASGAGATVEALAREIETLKTEQISLSSAFNREDENRIYLEGRLGAVEQILFAFSHRTFWQRLRWLLLGR